ncbi:MAG TPA: hypothetical protein VN397_03735 [Candidatus Methylomirabilis sp.]|nr:hypothetical protein [Candidatus Methylomirabilis sp.]
MKQDSYLKLTGAIFLVIAVLHAARLLFQWTASIGGWDVPMWLSGMALVVSAYLAYVGLQPCNPKK